MQWRLACPRASPKAHLIGPGSVFGRPAVRTAIGTSQLLLARLPSFQCSSSSLPLPPSYSAQIQGRRTFHTSVTTRRRTVDYLLADVGEGITECEIIKWFVEPGSTVEEFDVLVEVQSDKASVEITSRYAGKVTEHCYKVGEVAKVGSALCRIEMEGEVAQEQEQATDDAPAGQKQQEQQQEPEGLGSRRVSESDEAARPDQKISAMNHSKLATPAVRRITREHNVDIGQIQGTGKDGRVTKDDVHSYVQQRSSSPETEGARQSAAGPTVARETAAENDVVVPLSSMRRAMFKAMTSTWTIPHFGYSDEVDVTQLDAIRRQAQASSQALGSSGIADDDEGPTTRLTLLPLLIKAMSLAMRDFPLFRSQLDVSGEKLHQRSSCDISIALSTEKGLLTPTIAEADALSTLDIAKHIASLQSAAASSGGSLSRSQLGPARGGTLTMSNIGSVGGTGASPLIPPTGQLAIGALGRARYLPRYSDGGRGNDIVKRLILPVAFTADHRVVEGVELARLVDKWKRLVEEPGLWMVNMR
ncbi:CoA-dependent acyltransferase [Acaromyces ingoldii]|uniref:Dihydrolipoamide acetyltransferase component of pyruvate dehydrogenase complex n=1 Tax=Acaromyces ingoldii TaxID=215250 RepID=A0A316YHM6_9BASI|nr:CoA-dependent acyltransferase [Acaromyces ingoldii]PWN88672.1 CoA-dependent acyltransferase [Acaromyces ingoldii]